MYSISDSGVGNYCTISIYLVQYCDCDMFGGFGILVLPNDCCDIKEILAACMINGVNLCVTPVNI